MLTGGGTFSQTNETSEKLNKEVTTVAASWLKNAFVFGAIHLFAMVQVVSITRDHVSSLLVGDNDLILQGPLCIYYHPIALSISIYSIR